MFSYVRAYAYLLFAESRPASRTVADPLASLLTQLVSAPIDLLARRSRDRAANRAVPRLQALPGAREHSAVAVPAEEAFRPAA